MAAQRMTATTKVDYTPRARVEEIIFTRSGAVALSETPAHRPGGNLTVVGLSVTLTNGGSTQTTVVLKKNGTVVATCHVAPNKGHGWVEVKPAVTFIGRVDAYSIAITEAGSGASDLSGAIEVAA